MRMARKHAAVVCALLLGACFARDEHHAASTHDDRRHAPSPAERVSKVPSHEKHPSTTKQHAPSPSATSSTGASQRERSAKHHRHASPPSDEPNKVGVTISVMLLGGISFVMSLFYLVNHPDPDMKRYSWQVISATISIFCAVLIFSACNGVIEEYLHPDSSILWGLFVGLAEMVVWFTALQIVLAVVSGSLKKPGSLTEVELNMKCWAVLFAHVCGFASINSLGNFQHLAWLSADPALSTLVVPLGGVGLYILYFFFDVIRQRIAQADDGEIDEYEEAWDEEAEEAENDVAGLSLSFVTVQSIRFAISGVLPDSEGIEGPETAFSHTNSQVHLLAGAGIGFLGSTLLSMIVAKKIGHHAHEHVQRILAILENFFSTGFAWCFFFAAKWGLSHAQFTHEEALLRVSLALLLSFISFICIFFLDKFADMDATGEDADKAIRTVVEALGILVGFSWEQSFDIATDFVVEGGMPSWDPAIGKLFLSILLVAIVLPAWRIYILPTEHELSEEKAGENEKEEEPTIVYEGQLFNEEALRSELREAKRELEIRTMQRELALMKRDLMKLKGSQV